MGITVDQFKKIRAWKTHKSSSRDNLEKTVSIEKYFCKNSYIKDLFLHLSQAELCEILNFAKPGVAVSLTEPQKQHLIGMQVAVVYSPNTLKVPLMVRTILYNKNSSQCYCSMMISNNINLLWIGHIVWLHIWSARWWAQGKAICYNIESISPTAGDQKERAQWLDSRIGFS